LVPTITANKNRVHLNAASAERILDGNREHYESTNQSESLFFWKDHDDGKQHILNPKQVSQIRSMIASIGEALATGLAKSRNACRYEVEHICWRCKS
jgi:hypothetical protein